MGKQLAQLAQVYQKMIINRISTRTKNETIRIDLTLHGCFPSLYKAKLTTSWFNLVVLNPEMWSHSFNIHSVCFAPFKLSFCEFGHVYFQFFIVIFFLNVFFMMQVKHLKLQLAIANQVTLVIVHIHVLQHFCKKKKVIAIIISASKTVLANIFGT